MASIDVAKLLNKITQDIPGINTVLKELAKWDVSALTDVPDGAMQATTDINNKLTIKKKVSGSYTPVAKLMHDVDTVDGYHASASATANTVAVRDASGALPGNILGNAVTANTATALATGTVVPVNQGGTGATTASQARTNLGVADGADFTTHIAKQASPSVEGHVKLDALAAGGSNTAAPGGFGLGVGATVLSDWNVMLKPGWYASTNTALNVPMNAGCCGFIVCSNNAKSGYQLVFAGESNTGRRIFTRRFDNGTFAETWTELPNGITNSTTTASSTVAASAAAVKAVNDAALAAQTDASTALARTAPATTTSRGIGRVATSADLVAGATINNGPAFLAAGDVVSVIEQWRFVVGEFYYFRHPTLKTGFAAAQGGLISGVYQGKNITKYPIWAYLQTAEGQLLCKTEAEWQAMTTATWATLADGSKVGWNGIGGAPYYVQDLGSGTLRMPDIRGMYAEAVGFDSLGVGGVHGDVMRRILAAWAAPSRGEFADTFIPNAAYHNSDLLNASMGFGQHEYKDLMRRMFDSGRVVPTGNKTAPRAWGALACCYLGQPA